MNFVIWDAGERERYMPHKTPINANYVRIIAKFMTLCVFIIQNMAMNQKYILIILGTELNIRENTILCMTVIIQIVYA